MSSTANSIPIHNNLQSFLNDGALRRALEQRDLMTRTKMPLTRTKLRWNVKIKPHFRDTKIHAISRENNTELQLE